MSETATLDRPRSRIGIGEALSVVVDVCRRAPRGNIYATASIAEVIRRWNFGHGDDTAAIAAATGIPEHDVCRIVAADRDRRHAARPASHPSS